MPNSFTDLKGRLVRARGARAAIAVGLALSMGGCAVERLATATTTPAPDYWNNHPIEMTEAPSWLSVFPGPGRMDRATEARLKQFAKEFKESGVGQVEVLYPQGASNEASLRSALPEIRRVLGAAGVSGYLSVGNYQPKSPDAAQPIRLAFRALRARVANKCGEWPTDLASAGSLDGWQNRPYWNFGCSYQNMIAQQVDDPRDLAAPRADTPIDVEMRRRAIEKVRSGSDPTTGWSVSVGGVAG